jgi:hypothetical protein
MASKRGLKNVLFLNLDLVIRCTKIYFGKIFFSPQLFDQIIDPRNLVHVHGSILVNGMVINSHSQCTILLLNQHYQRSKWARAQSNVTHLQQLLDSFIDLVFINFGMVVGVSYDFLDPFLQFYYILEYPIWRYT